MLAQSIEAKKTAPGVWLVVPLSTGYLVGSAGPAIMPLWLAKMPAEMHLSATTVGYLASFEIVLIALTTVLASMLLKVCGTRLLAILAALLVCGGNLLSLDAMPLLIAIGRGLSGIGMGALLASVVAVAASQPRAQATLATMKLVAVAFLAPFFFFVTTTGHDHTCFVIFATLAGLAALTAVLQIPLPEVEIGNNQRPAGAGLQLRPVLLLLAAAVLFVGYGCIWSFVVRIGVGNHFTPAQVGTALSLSALAGIGGPFIARVVSDRYGLVRPIFAGGIVLALVAISLPLAKGLVLYILGVGVLAGLAPFLTPYIIALVGSIALDARYAAASLGCVLFGIAGGPTVATQISKLGSFELIGVVAAAFALVGMGVLALILGSVDRKAT